MKRINFLSNYLTKKDQDHPISLRAIRYAAVLFMVLMVGVGNVWGV